MFWFSLALTAVLQSELLPLADSLESDDEVVDEEEEEEDDSFASEVSFFSLSSLESTPLQLFFGLGFGFGLDGFDFLAELPAPTSTSSTTSRGTSIASDFARRTSDGGVS